MDTQGILQASLDYIDAHIGDPLTVNALAARAGFSPWHFCKLFQWAVGETVMGYVRGRRLRFAAHALSSDRRILDIALEHGFETHSGFSKAFRRQFGCAPEVYRRHACAARPAPARISPEKFVMGGIAMEPRFIEREGTRIAGYRLTTTSRGGVNIQRIPEFWEAYLKDGRARRLHAAPFVKNHDEYGACFPEDPETGDFEYLIAVEVEGGADVPEEFEVREIPAAQYAVFSTPACDAPSFSGEIQRLWDAIFTLWFPDSGYEFAAGGVDFELYDAKTMGETGNVCQVWVPVVRKTE